MLYSTLHPVKTSISSKNPCPSQAGVVNGGEFDCEDFFWMTFTTSMGSSLLSFWSYLLALISSLLHLLLEHFFSLPLSLEFF
jgi:hypothetical protein